MKARLWGTRGSLPTPRRAATGYGGNTSCVAVQTDDDSLLVLDAGTGITALGAALPSDLDRIDILLTHLHMDHIIGLGFFAGLFRPGLEVHLWGPRSAALSLGRRLSRYLSPPLFPVRLRDLPCRLTLHDVPDGTFEVPGLKVTSVMVCHPGPTVGYRLEDLSGALTYLPDHEPALGARVFPDRPAWTSGFDLAVGVDVLIHDAQYDDDEYAARVGWGHSAVSHALAFGQICDVAELVLFHHDPGHDDTALDALYGPMLGGVGSMVVTAAHEGDVFTVGGGPRPEDRLGPVDRGAPQPASPVRH